jgi:hypothetical protein
MKTTKLEERMLAYVESAGEVEKGDHVNYFVMVATTNGPITLKYWNVQNKASFPKPGEFLEMRSLNLDGAINELSKYRTLSMDSKYGKQCYCEIFPVNEEDVPEDIRRKIRKDRNLQRAEAKKFLGDDSYWRDRKVHDFLLGFVKEHSEKFATAPAAVGHHHAYRGGLFVHSCEVFLNCVGLASNSMNMFYEPLETDALYLAAWLHDAGKMEIYYMDGDSPKMDSDREDRIGHPTISDRLFLRAVEGKGFSGEFVDLVSHCILSHHNRPKWGAVVRPATKEAQLLCQADWLSSRNKG